MNGSELLFFWANGLWKCCLSHFEDSFLSAHGVMVLEDSKWPWHWQREGSVWSWACEHTGDEHHHGDVPFIFKGSLQYHNSQETDPTHEAHLKSIPQSHSLQNLTFQKAALEAEPFPSETAQVSAWITFNHQVTHYPFKVILF